MATKNYTSIDKMLAEAEAKVRKDLTEISALVRRDFRKQAQNALISYYANYTPKVYSRTKNLIDNAINDDMSFDDFMLSNKDSYGAWVHFNADEMADYEQGDKDVVLSNFMYGIHGKSSIYVEPNPAMTLMKEFQANYKSRLDKYFLGRGCTVN